MGEKKSLVSVVIPSYNSAKYLPATLDSVLAQEGAGSLFELEIIVVDDGSTDDTQAVVEEYGEKIIYCKIKNSGRPAVPRNVGAKLAKGEFLAFLDSDDIWLPTKLKEQLGVFTDHPGIVLVSSNAEKIDAKGKRFGELVVSKELLPKQANYCELLKDNFICTSATVVRKDAFLSAGGFSESPDLKAVEDYDLWLRLASRGEIAYKESATILYRVHQGNISKANGPLAIKRLAKVYKNVAKNVEGKKNKRAAVEALSAAHYSMASLSGGIINKLLYRLAAKTTSLHARLLYN